MKKMKKAGVTLEDVDQEKSSDESGSYEGSDEDSFSEMSSDAGGSHYEGIPVRKSMPADKRKSKKRKSKKKNTDVNAMPFALSKNKHRNDDLFVFKSLDV